MQSKTGELPINQIYLDPNNYRFRDHKDYRKVGAERIMDSQVQKRTMNFITGKDNAGISDLIASFKKSGFLPVDQIQVTRINDDQYKVIEGNRRIATLKYLYEEYLKGNDIGELNPNIFEEVPVVHYDENNSDGLHYKVLMGLKHINGNKRWPAVNQAQLMKDMQDAGMDEDDIIDSIGVTKYILRRSIRALALVEAYKDSDYGDQFQADMFNIFDTAVGSTNIKSWIDWDDHNKEAQNKKNLNRFFSWISTIDDTALDEEGQNENIRNIREPIINTGRDVRELSKFIDDTPAIEFMEESGSIAEAYLSSDLIGRDKFDAILDTLEKNLTTALTLSSYAEERHAEKFGNINKKLNGLIASQNLTEILLPKAAKPRLLFDFPTTRHFVNLKIKAYKGLSGVSVKNLNKINLFAGENNVGKTSLLEAVRILVAQNDANDFLALQQLRGKFPEGKMPPYWVVENVKNKISINGNFGIGGQLAQIKIEPYKEEDESMDGSKYLGSIKFRGAFMGKINESNMRLFEQKDNSYDLSFRGLHHLCAMAYFSPFGSYRSQQLFNAHAESIESKHLSEILHFLKSTIDEGIENVSLVEKYGLKRFLVDHNDLEEKAVDLIQFGDGMQNIFKTILLFAIAENGIVLIDEMETAIHHSLLVEYSKFIQKLSEKFNTQVFITSHSDECIDAFVENGYSNDQISMYHLEEGDGKISCKFISGERYMELSEVMGIDLRD